MNGKKRVFLIVLDSVGIGNAPDAAAFGDAGSNTVYAASGYDRFYMPNMEKLGLFDIDGVTLQTEGKNDWLGKNQAVLSSKRGAYGRMTESSQGKDTTIGHWEIAGIISPKPLPTFPQGFPKELLEEFSKRTGHGVLCNRPYSGTDVIRDYGKQHMESADLIVYTSADSVFQIAAHEQVVPVEELYRCCQIARELLQGEAWGVGRVIARPFEGEYPFRRTTRRHDYSLEPPKTTMLDVLKENGLDVLAVGKIYDIFAGKGITQTVRTTGNEDGIQKTIAYTQQDFEGLCFVNLVDFDMLYGHRNDVDGYGRALSYFDEMLPQIMEGLGEDDLLMITADHGCDPSTPSTDHSRECTPWLIAGEPVKENVNLGTMNTFADIAATILDYFGLAGATEGSSQLGRILKA